MTDYLEEAKEWAEEARRREQGLEDSLECSQLAITYALIALVERLDRVATTKIGMMR